MFDAVINLYDDSGAWLASIDDTPLTRQDPWLSFTAPDSGEYIVEIHEAGFEGSEDSRYALHLGTSRGRPPSGLQVVRQGHESASNGTIQQSGVFARNSIFLRGAIARLPCFPSGPAWFRRPASPFACLPEAIVRRGLMTRWPPLSCRLPSTVVCLLQTRLTAGGFGERLANVCGSRSGPARIGSAADTLLEVRRRRWQLDCCW
jgi:hypothetical protein